MKGQFYRAIFERDLPHPLRAAQAPEGRFHHDGQQALYLSPSILAVRVAMQTYLAPNDPPRQIVPIWVEADDIVDLRQTETLSDLGCSLDDLGVNWRAAHARNCPASSWARSDAAHETGAEGMIYASRNAPDIWHLALFRGTTATARQNGSA